MKERSNSIFRVHWQRRAWKRKKERKKEGQRNEGKGKRRSKYFKSSSSFELKRLRNHSPPVRHFVRGYCSSDHVRAPFNRLIWIPSTFSPAALHHEIQGRHEFARIVARIRNCRANFIGRPRTRAQGTVNDSLIARSGRLKICNR